MVVVACVFFQAEAGIRYLTVTGVQTCALPISGEVEVLDREVALFAAVPLRAGGAGRDQQSGGEGEREPHGRSLSAGRSCVSTSSARRVGAARPSTARGAAAAGGREAAPGELPADTLGLEPAEHTEQLVLVRLGHLELVERLDEVLDERVELRVRDAHAGVGGSHVTPGVGAGA